MTVGVQDGGMKRICVIGGSRYFGKVLVQRLQATGHRVTVINCGSTPPPPGGEHLVADRDEEAALIAALGSRSRAEAGPPLSDGTGPPPGGPRAGRVPDLRRHGGAGGALAGVGGGLRDAVRASALAGE